MVWTEESKRDAVASSVSGLKPYREHMQRSITSSQEKKGLSKIPQRTTYCNTRRMAEDSMCSNHKTIRIDARSTKRGKKDERIRHKVLSLYLSRISTQDLKNNIYS